MPRVSALIPSFRVAFTPFTQSFGRYFSTLPRVMLPPKRLYTPYRMDQFTWSQIQELTHDLKKQYPLAADVLAHMEVEGMSLGAISPETHAHIAQTMMALAGARTYEELIEKFYRTGLLTTSNSGEGGDIHQHLVKQIASSRFGVTLEYVIEAAILQFKAAQGVKPGVGGALSGIKVTELVAFLRNCEPWKDLFSPGPHHDTYSIEDFAQVIVDYSVNPNVRWSTKLFSEPSVGTIAVGVAKAMGISESGHKNNIVITGQGSTGNTPLFTKFHVAHPWFIGLANTHWKLTKAGIRDTVTLTASGGFVGNFFDAFVWGANTVGIGTLALIGDGCVKVDKCHNNTCPAGVATLDPELRAKNQGTPLTLARTLISAAKLTALKMQPYFDSVDQAVGRAADIYEADNSGPLSGHEKYLIRFKEKPRYIALGKLPAQPGPSQTEREVIEAIRHKKSTVIPVEADNRHLAFGRRLNYYAKTDEDIKNIVDTKGVELQFNGLATGQSFAVLGTRGLTYQASTVHTNDGTAKSLSGGTVYAKTCGNQAGMGMTEGFVATQAVGSRGAIRKSGGVMVTEFAGAFFANFHTRGRTYVLGSPAHYSNLTVDNYKPPIAFKDHALGFGFLSGFSGGTIYIPKLLWEEALQLNHVSPTVRNQIKPQKLTEQDQAILLADLKQSADNLQSPLQKQLVKSLEENPALINEWFVKLEAPRSSLAPKQETPTVALIEEKLPAPPINKTKKATPAPIDKSNPNMVMQPDREKAACGTGLIMDLDGKASHDKLQLAVTALHRLEHRGARGVDPLSGDGCGLMLFFGNEFFDAQFPKLKLELGNYAVMCIFMPRNPDDLQTAEKLLSRALKQYSLDYADKRDVPTDDQFLGIQAKADELQLKQYIVLKPETMSGLQFDSQLSLAQLNFEIRAHQLEMSHKAHCASASRKYVVYKTKGKEKHIADIYPDLKNPQFAIMMALLHARYATNTDTIIENVQPLMIAMFNGEINNLRRFIAAIKYDAQFSNDLGIDLKQVDFTQLSDSAIMAIYMKMLQLKGYDFNQIHDAIFHAYDPKGNNSVSKYNNLMGMPGLEGPNGSIRVYESGDELRVAVETDTMGWRPHRGILDTKRRLLVTGSEIGIVQGLEGDLIDLGPGEALDVDPTKGIVTPLKPSPQALADCANKLEAITEVKANVIAENTPIIDNLQNRKLMAGLTPEIETTFLQPLYNDGKGFTVSMGDDTAPEVTVSGLVRVINTVKTDAAQITRPPLDYQREEEVMTTWNFVGAKATLDTMPTETVKGYFVRTPIIDNHQMQTFINNPLFKTRVIDITYAVCKRETAMLPALERVKSQVIEAAKDGVGLIVLSDLKTDAENGSLLPMLVAGAVNLALCKAGLRQKVTLCMQSAICATPLEQIVAISLGIDIINPYLIFAPDSLYYSNKEEFARQRQSYIKMATKELIAASARAGIRTLNSGYRQAVTITALGLDPEVADAIGIYSEVGGFDWANIAVASVNQHIRPSNIGKYLNEGQTARIGKWNRALVSTWRKVAKGEVTFDEVKDELQANIDASNRDQLEGWFKLKPPVNWTPNNPMTIVIVGGGAAGFTLANALLNSHMAPKIQIKMIEENPANLFGLVKDGIAPDKKSMKSAQLQLLSACLTDPRFQYYGGLRVAADGDVTPESLKANYPLVIDARGAPEDKMLTNIEGGHLFTSASKVWKAYNGYFDPLNPDRYWPFLQHSRNLVKVVIGNGNVAADIIRLLLTNADDIEMNPVFQERLRKQETRFIRNFARGSVLDCKITLKELESFEKNGISVYASFDEHDIDESKLTDDQRAKLEFFRRAKNKEIPLQDGPRVHFHFGCQPVKAYRVGRNILEIQIEEQGKAEIQRYRPSDIITAIGRESPKDELLTDYVVGWASGNGGNIAIINKSVNEILGRILRRDEERGFDHTMGPAAPQAWEMRASVTNKGMLNILAYCRAGNRLHTANDWRTARDYAEKPAALPSSTNAISQAIAPVTPVEAKSDELLIQDKGGANRVSVKVQANKTVLDVIAEAAKTNPAIPVPNNECGKAGTCQCCEAELVSPKKPIKHTVAERAFWKSGSSKFLTCQQTANDIGALESAMVVLNPVKKMK